MIFSHFYGRKPIDDGMGLYNGVINYSCMFDSASSTYMRYTPADAGTEETWTYSCWIKRTTLGSIQILLNAAAGEEISFTAADKLRFTTATGDLLTTQVLRDCSGWYHILVAVDTTQATEADRVNIEVNGVTITDFDTETYPNQNEVTDFLKASAHTLGANEGGTEEFSGYMAEFVLIDGIQYAAMNFGETSNGIWIPKEVSGLTFGTYGTWLDFADSADLGDDNSGSTNDWTETNFGADHQVTDTPENNHCILDINATRSNITALNEGGLSPRDADAAHHSSLGTFLMKTGKWYWEVDIGSDTSYCGTGILASGERSGDIIVGDVYIGAVSEGYQILSDGAAAKYSIYSNSVNTDDDNLDAPAADDVMTVAFDADNNKIWFGMKNAGSGHVWGDFGATGVGDPVNGTNPSYDSSDGIDATLYDYVPGVTVYAHSTCMVNFGQRAFSGTIPTGFKALNTKNLSALGVFSTFSDCATEDEDKEEIYIGNGNANGPYVYCGFRPADVCINGTHYDETDTGVLLFKANGFKLVSTTENTNNVTYTYEAWGDQDFKYANAR